jgi:hypothetical protein
MRTEREGRNAERGTRNGWLARTVVTWMLVGLGGVRPASAQVGHDPARSPFRDIRRGSGLIASVGWLGGDRGTVPVGPASGPTLGLRYDLSLGGPTVFLAGATLARLDRYVIDPDSGAATRRSGPEPNDLLLLEAGLQLRLTGGKTWRGLAPYLGTALGLAFDLRGPADPGNYHFGTKFTIAPNVGLRLHPGRRLLVLADLRATFWRLSYPTSYVVPNAVDSTTVLPAGASDRDWTSHPSLTLGVGWTF